MADYNDLQIYITKPDANSFLAFFQQQDPDEDDYAPPILGVLAATPQGLNNYLFEANVGDEAYGRKLRDLLFNDPKVKKFSNDLRGGPAKKLRLRLSVDSSAAELHQLAWEALRKPADENGTGALLTSDERILFSRLLPGTSRVPPSSRPRDSLRALVVIANPTNLVGSDDLADDDRPGLHLAPIDVALEKQLALEGLSKLGPEPVVLASDLTDPAKRGQASVANIRKTLRQGFDILYIVCHGALGENPDTKRVEPYLWLEKPAGDADEGKADRVQGEFLVEALSQMDLARAPRLIMLASCQSAGRGKLARQAEENRKAGKAADDFERGFVALGPRLASRVAPAVVAMHGNISMDTAHAFMPEFFAQLRDHGEIDRAMAAARGKVQVDKRYDAWRLVLFMSLKSGLVWYTPRFAGNKNPDEIWEPLITKIQLDDCLPILGPGLTEPLFGTRRDMARTWTERLGYPLAARYSDELPLVGQYLSNWAGAGPTQLRRKLLPEYLKLKLQDRLPAAVIDLLKPPILAAAGKLFKELGAALRADDPSEAHWVLARLPISIYLTTNIDDLLADALRACGKEPQVYIQQWKQTDSAANPAANLQGPAYAEPGCQNPLVYHLFGHISAPESLVLTEDDYFDYLMLINSEENPVLRKVRAELSTRTLLFLGFEMDDWPFRVLFRSILSDNRRRERTLIKDRSIGVQVSPEESSGGPERARRYLERYYEGTNIESYWGTAADFLHGLWERWPEKEKLCDE